MKLSYRWGSFVFAALFLLIGVFVFIDSWNFPRSSETTLGSGYMPRVLALLMIFCALLSMLTTIKKQDFFMEIAYAKYLIAFICLIFLYTFFFGLLNFSFILFIFLALSFGLLNREKTRRKVWVKCLSVSAVLTAVFYVAFSLVLEIF